MVIHCDPQITERESNSYALNQFFNSYESHKKENLKNNIMAACRALIEYGEAGVTNPQFDCSPVDPYNSVILSYTVRISNNDLSCLTRRLMLMPSMWLDNEKIYVNLREELIASKHKKEKRRQFLDVKNLENYYEKIRRMTNDG